MATQDAVVNFKANITPFLSETQKVIQQLELIQSVFGDTGRGALFAEQFGSMKQFIASITQANQKVAELAVKLKTLEQIKGGGVKGQRLAPLSPTEQAITGFGERTTRPQVEKAINATIKEGNVLFAQRRAILDSIEVVASREQRIQEQLLGISSARQFQEQKILELIGGQTAGRIVNARNDALQKQLEALQAAKSEIEAQVTTALGRGGGGRIDRDRADASQRLRLAEEEILRTHQRARSLNNQASDERIRGTEQARKLEQEIVALGERQGRARNDANRARRDLTAAEARLAQGGQVTGASEALARINAQIAAVKAEQALTRGQGVGRAAPEMEKLRQEALRLLKLDQEDLVVKEQIFQLLQKTAALEAQAPGRGIVAPPTPAELQAQRVAGLRPLEHTLFTAFDDVGRRFRTALQFAISGAVIFGAQLLVREFFQAAIEVERTFADIESALEFDLADQGFVRGTAAFDAEVEKLRRQVLQLANDFNVLPSIANEAAFKMVARFKDSENAIKAIRAQFLATKISTIDQSEALRALTATAEGFAAAVLESNDSLTFQERLLQRETVAAEGYAKALDEAVLIQQRFGIEVEDVLEGTARAAETFRQLGFTRQQTEATVSAVGFELGQTGVNVAERLNRAFGGITSPEVKNRLLDLAAANENFTLTFEDFDSGAKAIQAIDRQIQHLQQVDPKAALAIRDILGQRRETEVVAAFFGTADLRASIEASLDEAAGAAERRFGFLSVTISELIASIIAQFQSLAQNFERLELLAPLKVFLGGINLALSGLNLILQGLNNVVGFLDKIGDVFGLRLGTTLKNLIVFASTLLLILRTAVATAAVVSVARAGAAAVVAKGAASGAAGGFLAAIAPMFLGLSKAGRDAGGGLKGFGARVALAGRGMGTMTVKMSEFVGMFLARWIPGLKRFVVGIEGAAAGLGAVAIGLAAAALIINAFIQGGKVGIAARADSLTASTRAETATREQERITPFETPELRAEFAARQKIDILTQMAAEKTRGFWETSLAGLFPLFDKTTRESQGFVKSLAITLSGGLLKVGSADLIPGSKEWWDALIDKSTDDWRKAQMEAFTESFARLRALPDLTPEEQKGFVDISRKVQVASRRLTSAETPEEIAAATVEFDAVMVAAQIFFDDIKHGVNDASREFADVRLRLEQLSRDLEQGRVRPSDEIPTLRKIRSDALEQAGRLTGSQLPEDIAEVDALMAVADEAQNQIIAARLASLERQRNRISLIQDPATKLAAEAEMVNREIAVIVQEGRLGLPEWLELIDERNRIQDEAAKLEIQTAIDVAQRAVDTADTLQERIAATRILNDAIAAYAEAVGAGTESAAKAQAEIDANNEANFKKVQENAQKVAGATVRLGGPIQNRIRAINAQIAALRVKIAQGDFFDPGDAMEAQVQLAELIAQRSEAAADVVAASIRSQAGVNNSIRGLQAELAITARQMRLTAQLYGRNSAEFINLKVTQEQLRNSLVQAQLELEDLTRRLGTDITSDFAQAQLDLVEVIRRMTQTKGMGDLEKARLQLEKRQAEAKAQKAFFDDRLFNLRFAFETNDIGLSAYIGSLRKLLAGVDTSTQAGKEIFLEISSLIDGLTDDVENLQFNIPQEIRLPTIFEIRRAMAADQLGVNYMDNRVQTVTVEVSSALELQSVLSTLDQHFGSTTDIQFRRSAVGGSTITPGGF